MNDAELDEKEKLNFEIEFHKRYALSLACIVFALVGVGFGIQNNRRSGKSSGFVLAVGFIVLYWITYIAFEGLARNQTLPVQMASWLSNILFAVLALFQLRKKLE